MTMDEIANEARAVRKNTVPKGKVILTGLPAQVNITHQRLTMREMMALQENIKGAKINL